MKKNNHPLGLLGENLAKNFLEKRGYQIIDQNISYVIGEIDIIAKKNGRLFFVEVKARTSFRQGGALYAMTRKKFHRLFKAVLTYRQEKFLRAPYQIDYIAIQIDPKTKKAHLKLYENISWTSFGRK